MRRGLMAWDAAEIPLETLSGRATRLREAMQAEGFDGLLIYTNFVRPSAVAWLTAFTPYWSEAILYVPRNGEMVFATALSKRVGQWLRSVDPVGEIVHTPRPGAEIGRRIAADARIGRVGVLDFDTFPSGLFEDCRAAAGAVSFADGSATFGRARGTIDTTERALIARADELARDGLAAVDPGVLDAGSAVAAAEERVRIGGAEEAYVAIAPDLDADRRFVRRSGRMPLGPRFALRISTAYKGSWVRRIATFARDGEGAAAAALGAAWFDETIAGLDGQAPLGRQITAAVARLPGAAAIHWMAETCLGSYPLEVIAGAGAATERLPAEGSLVVLSLDLTIGGVPWSCGAPVILGGGGIGSPQRR
jgi:hypothetical protein